jgi:quercetin dioxygenase-like cupin family protein
MNCSRRELGWALPVLAARGASAEGKVLPSAALRFEDFTVRDNGKSKMRPVFNGETHTGFALEMHITELAPGESPHPPHRHVHEEMMCVQRGMLDTTVNGKTTRLTPGSVFYIYSNDEHGIRNPGTEPVQYFVIALGGDKA